MQRAYCERLCTGKTEELKQALVEKGLDTNMAGNLARKSAHTMERMLGQSPTPSYGDVAEAVMDEWAGTVEADFSRPERRVVTEQQVERGELYGPGVQTEDVDDMPTDDGLTLGA